MRLLATLALCLFTTPTVHADEIDDHVRSTLEALRIPGASVAAVRDGRVVKAAGYGLANLETGAAATPQTVYEIGSMTKQFTAVAAMMLVEEGRLDLEASLLRYFPDAPSWWGRIRVRHLLTHTSGIQNHVAVPGYLSIFRTNLFFEDTPPRDEVLRMFYALPKEFEPGQTWAYDNTGYYLLGVIIEKASGRSYFEFLDERIFRPLGMSRTRSTDPRPVVPGRAAGYEWVGDRWENRRALLPSIAFAAGALVSTVEDLARWDAALRSDTLLERSRLEQMWTPARTTSGESAAIDYGFGWFVETYAGLRDAFHGGGTPGFSSSMHRFVDSGLSVIVLTNHADAILESLALDVAAVYEPRLRGGTGGADPGTTDRHRAVFADLLGDRVEAAAFTTPMRIHLGTATGRSFFRWYASRGALSSFAPIGQDEAWGTSRVLRYRVGLGPGSYRFSFRVAADGRIAQIYPW